MYQRSSPECRDRAHLGSSDYGDAAYWDRRYRQQAGPFDWYQRYAGVAPLVTKYIPKLSRVLMVGCGNAGMDPITADWFRNLSAEEQDAYISFLQSARQSPSTTPSFPTPSVSAHPTPSGSAYPTPPGSRYPSRSGTPAYGGASSVPPSEGPSRRPSPRSHKRRRRESGGGGCCGGGVCGAGSSPDSDPRESPADLGYVTQVPFTPAGTPPYTRPSTPAGIPHVDPPSYSLDPRGHVVMDESGRVWRARLHQLCTVSFEGLLFSRWRDIPDARKDYVIDQLREEFEPRHGAQFSRSWAMEEMKKLMNHRRSDTRDCAREGGNRPGYCTAPEWDRAMSEGAIPRQWPQQQDAARARRERSGSSRLGSGGRGTFEADFRRRVGRNPTNSEYRYGYSYGLRELLDMVERGGEHVDHTPSDADEGGSD